MNGKVAKRLRRQAGVTTPYTKGMEDKDYKVVKVFTAWGEPKGIIKLNQANWSYYKQLKREHKQAA